MNKHTPTPWRVNPGEPEWFAFDNRFFTVTDKEGLILAFCKDWMDGDEPKKNAEHIVRCVNSHEALVSALQQARKWIREQMAENGCPEDRLDNPPAGLHLANIEAALAAAGAPQ